MSWLLKNKYQYSIVAITIIALVSFFAITLFSASSSSSSSSSSFSSFRRSNIDATETTTTPRMAGVDGDDDSFAIHMNARPSYDDQYCTTQRLVPSKYEGRTIVGFVPLPGYAAHHIMVYRCGDVASPNQVGAFSQLEGNSCVQSLHVIGCWGQQIMFVWANAGEPFYFPSNVGIPIRKGETFQVVTHYGIPTQSVWPVDRSGVRFVLKPTLQDSTLPSLVRTPTVMFDPRVILLVTRGGFSLSPNQKSVVVGSHGREPFSYSLALPSSDKHSFYLFAIRVHSHGRGIANEVRFYSDKTVTQPKFTYRRSVQLAQSFIPLKNIVEIHATDFLEFSCAYDTSHDSHHVDEGNTKHNEMCNIYLYGYVDKKTDPQAMRGNKNQPSQPRLRLHPVPEFRNEIGKQSQIVGVTVASSLFVYAFTRADRVWDSSSFNADEVFLHPAISQSVIFKLDSKTGKILKQFGEGMFYLPHSVRLDKYDENLLYVVDVGSHLVTVLDLTLGKPIRVLGVKNSPGSGDKQFCKPTDVAFSKKYVYVSDGYCNARVVVYDRISGEFVRVISNSRLQLPHAVSVLTCANEEEEEIEYLLVCNREDKSLLFLSTNDENNEPQYSIRFPHHPYAVSSLSKQQQVVVGLVKREGRNREGFLYVSDTNVCEMLSSAKKEKKTELVVTTNALLPLLREPHEFAASHTEENVFYVAEAVDGELTGDLVKMQVASS